MTASSSAAQVPIGHEGIANVAINQESVNQLMEGAQAIEDASSGVNEGDRDRGNQNDHADNGIGHSSAPQVVR